MTSVNKIILTLIVIAVVGTAGTFALDVFEEKPDPQVIMAGIEPALENTTDVEIQHSLWLDGSVYIDLIGTTLSDVTATSNTRFNKKTRVGDTTSRITAKAYNSQAVLGLHAISANNKAYVQLQEFVLDGLEDFLNLGSLYQNYVVLDPKNTPKSIQGIVIPDAIHLLQNTEDLVDVVESTLADTNLITITSQLKDQTIEDHETYHYAITINEDAASKLVSAFLEEASSDLQNSILAELNNMTGEIWIGKSDNLPYKITLEQTIPENKDANALVPYRIRSEAEFTYNQNFAIEVPKNTVSLEKAAANIVPKQYLELLNRFTSTE